MAMVSLVALDVLRCSGTAAAPLSLWRTGAPQARQMSYGTWRSMLRLLHWTQPLMFARNSKDLAVGGRFSAGWLENRLVHLEIYGTMDLPDHLFPSHHCSCMVHVIKIRFLRNSTVQIISPRGGQSTPKQFCQWIIRGDIVFLPLF
jgi:hypothetical protein